MSTIGGWKYEGYLYTRIPPEYPGEGTIIGDGSDLVHIQVFEDGELSYYCNGALIAAESFNSNRAKALPRCTAERIKERLQKEHPSAKICLYTYTKK